MTTRLLIIDPQNDFCDGPANGALAVPGAWGDMNRLARFIDSAGTGIDDITVTLDSHHLLDIGHPGYWQDSQGNAPAPFTLITAAEVSAGRWRPREANLREDTLAYLEALEAGHRYIHTIWPPHCLIGTPGHAIHPRLMTALHRWSEAHGKPIDFLLKGLNTSTEHYSAFKAEVPDGRDPSTAPDAAAIDRIRKADRILVAGEAVSHCVKSTVEDLAALAQQFFGDDIAPRLTLLSDGMSPVPAVPGGPDFPAIGRAFLEEMRKRGAAVTTMSSLTATRALPEAGA